MKLADFPKQPRTLRTWRTNRCPVQRDGRRCLRHAGHVTPHAFTEDEVMAQALQVVEP